MATSDFCASLADGQLEPLLHPVYWARCMSGFSSAIAIFIGAALSVLAWLLKVAISGFLTINRRLSRQRKILEALEYTVSQLRRSCEENYTTTAENMHIDRLRDRKGYSPYTITAQKDFLLQKIKDEVEIVPKSILNPTLEYIYNTEYIDAASRAFMSDDFRSLAPERKEALVRYTFATARETAALCDQIIDTLAARQRLFGRLRVTAQIGLIAAAIVILVLILQATTATAYTSGGSGLRRAIKDPRLISCDMTVSFCAAGESTDPTSPSEPQYRGLLSESKGSPHAAA